MGGKKKKSAAAAAPASTGKTAAVTPGGSVAEEGKNQPQSNKPAKAVKDNRSKGVFMCHSLASCSIT